MQSIRYRFIIAIVLTISIVGLAYVTARGLHLFVQNSSVLTEAGNNIIDPTSSVSNTDSSSEGESDDGGGSINGDGEQPIEQHTGELELMAVPTEEETVNVPVNEIKVPVVEPSAEETVFAFDESIGVVAEVEKGDNAEQREELGMETGDKRANSVFEEAPPPTNDA